MSRPWAIVGVLVVVAGCAAPPGSPAASIPGATANATATGIAAPTPALTLDPDVLRSVALDPITLTAVCDIDDGSGVPDGAATTVACGDAVQVAVGAVVAVAGGPVDRVYLRRSPCATTGCTPAEADTATAYAWTPGRVFRLDLRGPLDVIGAPVPVDGGPWPATGIGLPPPISKPDVPRAPAQIGDRTAYPYCGAAVMGEPASVLRCFRDAVVSGRPAEMDQTSYGTEGEEIALVYRFGGVGAVLTYQGSNGHWIRQWGSIVIGPDDANWSFDPWDTDGVETTVR